MEYIFVAGVHGAGKTTLTQKLRAKGLPIISKSISDLIRQAGKEIEATNKKTEDIKNNQELWKKELKKMDVGNKILLLDGHFSLLNEEGNVVPLGAETFEGTHMKKIILVSPPVDTVLSRLELRDNHTLDKKRMIKFMTIEKELAQKCSLEKEIPLLIVSNDGMIDNVIDFILE